jgi:hypothetical protein
LLPFGHFLARLSYALELFLPLDELVLTLLRHIPPLFFFRSASPRSMYSFRRKKTQKPLLQALGGETAKTKSESVTYIDLPAADVKN